MHFASVVDQFTAERIGEPAHPRLGRAIGALQRDAAISERRADLHDRPAIARLHSLQRRHRAVDRTEISHLRYPPEIFRRHFLNRGKDANHGVVNPDIDRPQFALDFLGRSLDCGGIRDIDRQDERAAAGRLDFAARCFQAVGPTREQTDLRAIAGELAHDGAADAGGRSGDDDDFRRGLSLLMENLAGWGLDVSLPRHESVVNFCQQWKGHARQIEREDEKINGGRAIRAMFLVTPRTGLDCRAQLPHPADAAQGAIKFRILEQGQLRITARGKEGFAPAEKSVVAERDPEKVDGEVA